MTTTSASVRFGANGVTGVESFIRLTGHTYIHCCLYDDIAPILTVQDAHVDISITVPGPDEVTADDVTVGRLLAEAVGQYVAELERRASPGREDAAAAADGAGAGGVMSVSMQTGRLELVPPAACRTRLWWCWSMRSRS